MKRHPTRAAATAADLAMSAQQLRALVAGVKVPGTVLQDLDRLAQRHCDAIGQLVDQAQRGVADKAAARPAVRLLLRRVQDHAARLAEGINAVAEDHGCNYVDTRPPAAPLAMRCRRRRTT